jgi:predicted AAA+ superfamily ATPase
VQPRSWGQIQVYTEKYLKPVFVAHAIALAQIDELGKNLNYSELARRLNIADGTTVKMHLQRYIERFRQKRPET